ncbi:MAG: hypothetical protein SGI88_03620 [Candidatus Hydrogenedentes bacterium]|nr:hypothetical protein [Candidatus Hydrogenedentota bacterium]
MSRWLKWDADLFDPILRRYHSRGMNDHAIAHQMQTDGLPFSYNTIRNRRLKLRLKVNRVQPYFSTDERQLPKERPDPLRVASQTLQDFDRATLTYRGQPISLTQVMRMTNRIRAVEGLPQIDANPNWRVPFPG